MKLQQWVSPFNNSRAWTRLSLRALRGESRFSTGHGPTDPAAHQYQPLPALQDASIDHFREHCFTPERPGLLPRRQFRDLPAFERWFLRPANSQIPRLNTDYLENHGGASAVPLELTQPAKPETTPEEDDYSFKQFHAPLSLFLQWMRAAETERPFSRLYLAQCQLLDLPQTLRDDFPVPELVACAGRGDIYDTNVWIGHPPTYTPLHRDPNPNLFVQLAGRKVVRVLPPDEGSALFGSVRRRMGKSGNRGAAAFRGDDMMKGQERALLEDAVWGDSNSGSVEIAPGKRGYEAELDAGDGVFIPKGWWHSIKGIGEGVTASVSFLNIRSITTNITGQLVVSLSYIYLPA